ncbi:MAG: lamin tail domain-containing protein, partial [Akkermansiaceae bacterium]|nr:lamin tail domain-containing protein [Akkermansiaceae bacterium]
MLPPPHTLRAALGAFVLCAALPVTAAPRLTEFMASNDRSVTDEDGDSSDWIEIHNPGPGAADLSGWFLTDDPQELTKWSLPVGTSLASDGYLLVFASGKDRAVAGAELHTNFQLEADGEFLALVAADGLTVTSSFGSVAAPFPRQRADISYGTGEPSTEAPLLAAGAPLRFLVPASAGALDPEWNASSFPDRGWANGAFALG